MSKRIVAIILILMLVLSSFTAFAADMDLKHKVTGKDVLIDDILFDDDVFFDVISDLDSYYIEWNKNHYNLSEVQTKFNVDPSIKMDVAVAGLTPVDLLPNSEDFILTVKEGSFDRHSYPLVEQAFENAFNYPQWEYFYSTDNLHIVEFTGKADIGGIYGTVLMQFEVDYEEAIFNLIYCEFNNKPKSNDEIVQLLDMIYIKEEYIPYRINILPPNIIGTVHMEATYTNLTSHPVTSFSMKVLYKDTNKTGYLSNYDTVMPGETSPIFDTFGPSSMKLEDVEILTINMRVELPYNEYLRVDYDAKLGRHTYNWYNY